MEVCVWQTDHMDAGTVHGGLYAFDRMREKEIDASENIEALKNSAVEFLQDGDLSTEEQAEALPVIERVAATVEVLQSEMRSTMNASISWNESDERFDEYQACLDEIQNTLSTQLPTLLKKRRFLVKVP